MHDTIPTISDVYSNLVLFPLATVTQKTLLKHGSMTATRGFMDSDQVLSAQNVLQRLVFVHFQSAGKQDGDQSTTA